MREYVPQDWEKRCIDIMLREVTDWEQGWVWVTDRVKYNMRDIIMRSRRNYLGKFKSEYDEVTNKKKIFIPLTEDMVETIVKNIDLDSIDINIKATNSNGYKSASILRYLVDYFMRRNYFGEVLNEAIRQFCIDGTVIMKTLRNYDLKTNQQKIDTFIPDITNIYIDPTELNIQDAGAIIERNVMKVSEIQDKDNVWDNTDILKGYRDLARVYRLSSIINPYGSQTQVPYAEIYERWGDLPLNAINPDELTKEEQDMTDEEKEKIWKPCVAIVSNLTRSPVVHKTRINKNRLKPYEECRFRKVFGRWHGRGIGEILLGLQSYINETINLRLNKARVSGIGLFKIRKGSGINQNIMTSLMSGGGIPVTKMDDIEELPISDIKSSSYKDEEATYQWSQRAVGAFETGRGEMLPSSMPATTAVLQNQGQASGFDLLQENLGLFLSRVFERHIIPKLIETLKDEEVISIIGDAKQLKEIDENRVNTHLNQVILDHWTKKKSMPDPMYIDGLRKFYMEQLKDSGTSRDFKVYKKMLTDWQYEVRVFVTNESFNKSAMVQQLNSLLQTYTQLPGGKNLDTDAIFKEVLDLMGLGGTRFLMSPADQQAQQPNPMQNFKKLGNQQNTPNAAAGALTSMASGNQGGVM